MRIYLSPAISNFINLVVLIGSIGVALVIGARAFQFFTADSALDQIPSVLQESKP